MSFSAPSSGRFVCECCQGWADPLDSHTRSAGACLHGNKAARRLRLTRFHMREFAAETTSIFALGSRRQFAAREAFSSLEEFMLQLQQEFLTNFRVETKQSVQLFRRRLPLAPSTFSQTVKLNGRKRVTRKIFLFSPPSDFPSFH